MARAALPRPGRRRHDGGEGGDAKAAGGRDEGNNPTKTYIRRPDMPSLIFSHIGLRFLAHMHVHTMLYSGPPSMHPNVHVRA